MSRDTSDSKVFSGW